MKKWGVRGSLLLALAALTAATARQISYSTLQQEAYLSSQQIAFVRPGLVLEITDVSVAANQTVSVTFTFTDDRGLPLDLQGVFTPGEITVRPHLAYIPQGEAQYVSYFTNSAGQADRDRGATLAEIEIGTYRFTFSPLPGGIADPDATHTVGLYADRDLTEFELGEYVANAVEDFVPSGGELPAVRDVVSTVACNQCHDPLALHGGVRREVGLCVMCHQPQSVDPDTGNTVDFKVMIHKIHMGENLPSVQAGTPYQIIGFRGSVHDYSEVVFPQDIRNCESCHTSDASQQMAYLLRPTRDTCGSCHDEVNFATGEGHIGGPQPSDSFCASCHFPEGELEFDASIKGAHTVPSQSRQLEGINIEFQEIQNTGPGESPTILYTLTNDAGDPIAPGEFSSFSFVIAGPTTDYRTVIREQPGARSAPFEDGYTYTFQNPIPADAVGTFALGAEARRNVILNPGTTTEMVTRESETDNPVMYFAVTDPEPIPRRVVVDDAQCESCHANLEIHGGLRHNAGLYCVMCHNPVADDSARRPPEEFPAQTIDLKFMIHRIHSGEELTRDFTVYGFGGTAHTFNKVIFPGDLRNCAKCHVEGGFEVPAGGILDNTTEREFFTPIPPTSTACLSCHDTIDTAAHAYLNIAPFGEACATCHGEGAEFAVSKEHAR